MSFFIIDPVKNTVADNIFPTGTSASVAQIVVPTTMNVTNINTPNPVQDTYTNLNGSGTFYQILETDSTVEVSSSTYLTLQLPTAMNNPNKKYIIMRSFGGAGILTVVPYSLVEKIDNDLNLVLLNNGDVTELISDGEGLWRTY